MSAHEKSSLWLATWRSRWTWIVLGLMVLFVLAVRVRLREMPLERDEGEYAYAGQQILQGIMPYKHVYNMKLPGTYAAYAVILAVFGETPSGVHLGFALVNVLSIAVMFLLGRAILDNAAGLGAAVAFGFMSLSPRLLGLQAHATHFVVLPALLGLLMFVYALPGTRWVTDQAESPSGSNRLWLFLGGLLLGMAFIMKQHGFVFGLFGFVWLAWLTIVGWSAASARRRKELLIGRLQDAAILAVGIALPYLLTCLIMWSQGVFQQFFFWTIGYAKAYVTRAPLSGAPGGFVDKLKSILGPEGLFWLLAVVGAGLMAYDPRTAGRRAPMLLFVVCSLIGVSVGFLFREHYFVLLAPSLALLTGFALSAAAQWAKRGATVDLSFDLPLPGRFIAVPVIGLFGLAAAVSVFGNLFTWFDKGPQETMRKLYRTSLFNDAVEVGKYLRQNAPPGKPIAVIGSEPEIYFYANRPAACGYIYAYPLMEDQPFAREMQQQFIREMEVTQPEYVVFINDYLSWLTQPGSDLGILGWLSDYAPRHMDLVKDHAIDADRSKSFGCGADGQQRANSITVWRRKKDS